MATSADIPHTASDLRMTRSPAYTSTYWCSTAAIALLASLSLLIDVPIATYAKLEGMPGDLKRFVNFCEVFAHGWGVLLIAATMFFVVPSDRRKLPRILFCAYGCGLLANVFKMFVVRNRPYSIAWEEFTGTTWQTFQGLTLGNFDHALQSFPSGHTATAFGFAFGLSWFYPHARGWFFTLAVLAGLQRIVSSAHYPSDVLCGATLALAFCPFLMSDIALGRWLTKFETRS